MSQQQLRTLTNRKGVSIETPYTDGEAFKRLERLVEDRVLSGFAKSLVDNGRRFNSISPEQFFWIHKLLLDHENPPDRILYRQIASAYQRALQRGVSIKNMKLNIKNQEGDPIQLSMAGPRSKYHGNVWVTVPERELYCGRITPEGAFFQTRGCPDDVLDVLDTVENHFEEFIPW